MVNLASSERFKKKPDVVRGVQGSPVALRAKLSCRSAYVMDAKTGKTIYAHMPDQPGQPASTIKVVTGLIAIESLKDKEPVYASRYAVNMPRSKMYMRRGASYKATDLINAVLLASANDASVALAEKVAGSEQAFARLMTKKAQALGAKNTICKTANGLTRAGQQSTPRDLAQIFNKAMENQEFADRMGRTAVKTSDGKLLRTHNKALWTVDGAVGGKTGYTHAARKTYVGKFQRGGHALVVAIMGSEAMWDDIAALVEYGFTQQRKSGVMQVAENVDDGESVRVPLSSRKKLEQEIADFTVLAEQKKKAKL
ncbi:D-alanyl-D-alanine carboxypeptidase family protein [Thiovibrio sp. JS02]